MTVGKQRVGLFGIERGLGGSGSRLRGRRLCVNDILPLVIPGLSGELSTSVPRSGDPRCCGDDGGEGHGDDSK
jgi:hypothetical protein